MLLSDIVFQLHNVFFHLAEKRKAILISSVLPKPFNLFVSSMLLPKTKLPPRICLATIKIIKTRKQF